MKTLQDYIKLVEDYDFELVFDESECGGTGIWSYYGLTTDIQTVSNILVRIESRGNDTFDKAKRLSLEVVKRWNDAPSMAKALIEAEEALKWFIENDETNDTPENEYYLNGLKKGKAALSQIQALNGGGE